MTHVNFNRKADYEPKPTVLRSANVLIDFVDLDTGEYLLSSKKTCVFNQHGQGEKYLQDLLESFKRGLRSGRNLRFCCDVKSVEPLELPLFDVPKSQVCK